MHRLLIAISFLSVTTGASAEPVALTGDDLKSTVSGSIVEIDTPLGTTVPMRFGNDGFVAAEAGVLAPVLGAAKDRGRWWVDGDKLCTKWFRWFDAQVRCLTITRDGTRIAWRKVDDGETGTATLIQKPAEQPAPAAKPQPRVIVADAKPVKKNDAAPEKSQDAGVKTASVEDRPQDSQEAADAPVAPTPVSVAAADAEKVLGDDSMMRFGGPGLLQAASPVAGSSEEAPSAAQSARGIADEDRPPVQLVPATANDSAKVPEAAPAAKQSIMASLSPLRPSGPAKVPTQKRALGAAHSAAAPATSAAARKPTQKSKPAAVATSSIRTVAFYRVQGVQSDDVLNVRRGPSEEHVSIASIPPTGRRVEITGRCQESWCPIRYGGIKGWVNRYYLAEEGLREEASSETRAVRR